VSRASASRQLALNTGSVIVTAWKKSYEMDERTKKVLLRHSDVDLLEVFSVADEQGHKAYANEVLDLYFDRRKLSPAVVSNVPTRGLLGAVLRLFWRQGGVGEGR
jgi:hypothetical protein